ncbi:MAG: response regulator [Pseudomonadota bacterium]
MVTEHSVLVVDDEEPIRAVFDNILTKTGYAVRLAESAEQALDILKKETFPVMFLDIQLPKMSGMDLCKKIREKNPVSVMYAMTGYATFFDVFECRKAGFDDFFKKPFSAQTIAKATGDAFERIGRWNL